MDDPNGKKDVVDVDDVEYVESPHKMTVAVVTKHHSELPSAAVSVAAFVNTIAERTGVPFVVDVQVASNPFGTPVRQAPVVGFVTDSDDTKDDQDEDDDDDGTDAIGIPIGKRVNRLGTVVRRG